mgnify:CR=1 FL=1
MEGIFLRFYIEFYIWMITPRFSCAEAGPAAQAFSMAEVLQFLRDPETHTLPPCPPGVVI